MTKKKKHHAVPHEEQIASLDRFTRGLGEEVTTRFLAGEGAPQIDRAVLEAIWTFGFQAGRDCPGFDEEDRMRGEIDAALEEWKRAKREANL